MGKTGRFGKYGEKKRADRLRLAQGFQGVHKERSDKEKGTKEKRKSDKRILVRRAKPGDLGFIRALSGKAFHIYGSYDELLPEWSESGVAVTLLAEKGKRPVGFGMLGKSSQAEFLPGSVEILAIAVEPLYRRRGVGDLLMREIVEAARARNAASLILHTALNNRAAQQLFKKHGFVTLAVKVNFYPMGQDALMMLKGVDLEPRS